MGSNAKKKTTFAKLAREHKLRERRIDKKARKDARKRDAEMGTAPSSELGAEALGDGAEPLGEVHAAESD